MADELLHQYGNQVTEQVTRSILALRKPNSLVIATGQQAGFFGGPLLTLLKTLSAKKWADQLTESHPEFEFIPVFWVEAEDHDFREIALYRQPMQPPFTTDPTGPAYLSAGDRPIPESWNEKLQELTALLNGFPNGPETLALIAQHYQTGTTFGQAFAGLMRDLLAPLGILVLNPSTPECKRLGLPVFESEILSRKSGVFVQESTETLTGAGFQQQIQFKQVNLFWKSDTGRHRLDFRDGVFYPAGLEETLSPEELILQGRDQPERYSPGVILRSLWQSTLFPVAAVITGPAETTYWAQFPCLFAHAGVPFPLVIPRASGVVLEPAIQRLLGKNQLSFSRDLAGAGWVKEILLSGQPALPDEEWFYSKLDSVFGDLSGSIQSIDPTLADSWNQALSRSRHLAGQVFEKVQKAALRRDETRFQQLTRIRENLFPDGQLQERSISWIYFVAQVGRTFPNQIAGQLTTNPVFHLFSTHPSFG